MVTCLIGVKKASNLGTGKPKRGPKKTRSTTKEADFLTCVERIFSRALLLVSLLQIQTSGCYGCGGDQVTWRRDNAALNDTCLPCIDCPDGMEPSIRCGGVAKYGTDLHCVSCKEGMYSDTYGKDQCRPCSLCSEGRSVKHNCSASQNRLCGSCHYGYYMNDVVSSCLPCSICCWDGKDQLESQCIDQGLPSHRHCKPRHKDGCELWTTAALTKEGTNTRGRIVITSPTTMKRTIYPRKTSRLKISSTVQHNSTQIQVNKSTVPFQSLSTERRQPAVEVTKGKPTSTTPLNQHLRRKNRKNTASTPRVVSPGKTKRSASESSENKRRIIIAVVVSMVVLILLAVIIKRNTVGNYLRWMKCRPVCKSRDSELGEGTESTSLGEINGVQGVLCPLNALKSRSLDAYEKVWKRLDKQLKGTKKGDFKTVAEAFGFKQEDIWELEKELQTSGSGSPSRQLLEALETRLPNLTVFEFIIVMKKRNIDRQDIVDILKDYLYK